MSQRSGRSGFLGILLGQSESSITHVHDESIGETVNNSQSANVSHDIAILDVVDQDNVVNQINTQRMSQKPLTRMNTEVIPRFGTTTKPTIEQLMNLLLLLMGQIAILSPFSFSTMSTRIMTRNTLA